MLKHWISAFRLRTLPLALSTILMGSSLALLTGDFQWEIFILCILVSISLQILSNLANDYGDGVKGTDNNDRIGPERAIQSGLIGKKEMKVAIIGFSLLSFILGAWLIFSSFNNIESILLFFGVGIAAIIAAITYTIGKKPYGYHGLGDVFVFLFFGLVGVLGTNYIQTHYFHALNLLPAISIGCFSTAVLNLNNMRDIENDSSSNKNTIVVLIGLQNAKKYHFGLFFIAYLSILIFLTSLSNFTLQCLLAGITFITAIIHTKHLLFIKKADEYQLFDSQLKIIAISSFLFSLMWLITIFFLS